MKTDSCTRIMLGKVPHQYPVISLVATKTLFQAIGKLMAIFNISSWTLLKLQFLCQTMDLTIPVGSTLTISRQDLMFFNQTTPTESKTAFLARHLFRHLCLAPALWIRHRQRTSVAATKKIEMVTVVILCRLCMMLLRTAFMSTELCKHASSPCAPIECQVPQLNQTLDSNFSVFIHFIFAYWNLSFTQCFLYYWTF